ncbi:hypothetical protein [Spiroplasma endosymbiont of Virgichneumon dumeticola]|uniref:hypothetical protein n=1 Tax=Spiroplasma endosymbiont of Virgichneumon dumeticola TaxID=3139323 RepID=UPI0035C9367D
MFPPQVHVGRSPKNNLINIEYQFISTFELISKGSSTIYSANWNLQTKSLVINPKSST